MQVLYQLSYGPIDEEEARRLEPALWRSLQRHVVQT